MECSKVNLIVKVNLILHGLELLGGAKEDQEDVVCESLPEKVSPEKDFQDGFFVTTHEAVGIWCCRLASHGCANM